MEFKPLLFRHQDTAVKAIDQLSQQLPFALLGVDTDLVQNLYCNDCFGQ
jgi:hypothetical protein